MMDKKLISVIIVAILFLGIYGILYGVVTSVLIPMDVNSFKNDLNAMPDVFINESTIYQLESQADIIENNSVFSSVSQEQRITMADNIKSHSSMPPELNQNWTVLKKYNDERALKYDLIIKGNVSTEIRSISDKYQIINNLSSQITTINQKMATDIQNGDNKAYADDLRALANTMRDYNTAMKELKTSLQNIINQIS